MGRSLRGINHGHGDHGEEKDERKRNNLESKKAAFIG
jgi:hypothetical protein